MINRHDLAKKFELIVQQEIKNHNDQILAHNKAVDKLRRVECENNIDVRKRANYLESKIDSVSRDNKEFCDSLILENLNLKSSLSDMSLLVEHLASQIQQMKIEIQEQQAISRKHEELHDGSFHNILSEKNRNRKAEQDIRHDIDLATKRVSEAFQKKLDDRDLRPCKVAALKSELVPMIEVEEVHTRGVLEEIRILNRDLTYEKSKIENLYTLIGRLQKKVL